MWFSIPLKSFFLNDTLKWSEIVQHPTLVICERKEDVKPIRDILWAHYKTLTSHQVTDAFQILTLDHVFRLIHGGTHTSPPETDIFLDAEESIDLAQLILLYLGAPSFESENIAKQLLSFLSFQDHIEDFLKLFLKFFDVNQSERLDEFNRLILASIQITQHILGQSSSHMIAQRRFQPDRLDPLVLNKFQFPQILWVSSPLYRHPLGEHQSALQDPVPIQCFRDDFFSWHERQTQNGIRWVLQPTLEYAERTSTPIHIEIYPSWRSLFEYQRQDWAEIWLGDLNLIDISQILRWDYSQGHQYRYFELQKWLNSHQMFPSFDQNMILSSLNEYRFRFHKIMKVLEKQKSWIAEIAQRYQLSFKSHTDTELFDQWLQTKKLRDKHPLRKPLHLYTNEPTSLMCLGYPHTPKKASWSVERLNHFFTYLHQQGIPIFQPASPLTYINIWSFFLNKGMQIQTVRPEPAVEWLYKINPQYTYKTVSHSLPLGVKDPLHMIQSTPSKKILGVRSLAQYLQCPRRYTLTEEVPIPREEDPFQLIDEKEIGLIYHKIIHHIHQDRPWPTNDCASTEWFRRPHPDFLQTFYRRYREWVTPIIQKSDWFESEWSCFIERFNITIHGRFDFIYRQGQDVWIGDLKTTNSRTIKKISSRLSLSTVLEQRDLLQLFLYALLWSHQHPNDTLHLQIVSVSYPFASQEIHVQSIQVNTQILGQLSQFVDQALLNLSRGERVPKPGKGCLTCPYHQTYCYPHSTGQ